MILSDRLEPLLRFAYANIGNYAKTVANSRGMMLEREIRKYNRALENLFWISTELLVLHSALTTRHDPDNGLLPVLTVELSCIENGHQGARWV